jgi:putative transposase
LSSGGFQTGRESVCENSNLDEEEPAMTKRAERQQGKQGQNAVPLPTASLVQVLLPMVTGMVTTKQDLMIWVQQRGLDALDELFRRDAEQLAGPKGKHREERTHHHWGSTRSELPFGGQRIIVDRPRVRTRDGREAKLPMVETFRSLDPLPERVVERILLGVSTRGYGRSVEAPPANVRRRGTSKSAASRHLVERTRKKLRDDIGRRLDSVELAALMIDGIEVAKQTLVVALGITTTGEKIPLGLEQGSTENTTLCTLLLNGLIERGLRVPERILCVIDGGKGIRKALGDVFGELAVVQRCQVHKRRNVRDLLSPSHKGYVMSTMNDAYKSPSADTARKRLRQLTSWLEANGEDAAASSLREGLEETLTVLKLGLGPTLRRSLSTTNAIENLNGTIRRVSRNVKRWRPRDMRRRWVGLAILDAEKHFHRIKGHRELPLLLRALRQQNTTLDARQEAA